MKERECVQVPGSVFYPQVGGLLRQGCSVRMKVRGNSMNPFLVDGRDEVVLRPFQEASGGVQAGEVVLARLSNGRYVLHRVVRAHGMQLDLMGDGSVAATEQVPVSEVCGVAESVVRKGRLFACSGWLWQSYTFVWRMFRPFRRELLAIWRRL